MDNQALRGLQHFKNYVGIKFQLYNSLFTSLPFHRIDKTGILLSWFQNNCEDGYKKKLSPSELIEDFFVKHTTYTIKVEKLSILFPFFLILLFGGYVKGFLSLLLIDLRFFVIKNSSSSLHRHLF